MAINFCIKLKQAAFKKGWSAAICHELTGAHFDSRWFVTIIMSMKLKASLAAYQQPILSPFRALV